MVRFLKGISSAGALLLSAAALTLSGCDTVDDNRIPNLAVSINLGDSGLWNTYGVAGFGDHRNFIFSQNPSIKIPESFHFTSQTYTGFGGILLIRGMDPYENLTDVPLAYDLACPVECKQDVRVEIEGDLYEAVCPVCHSHFDVTMAGGAPLSGPAATGKYKYGLRRYRCYPTGMGGYIITND